MNINEHWACVRTLSDHIWLLKRRYPPNRRRESIRLLARRRREHLRQIVGLFFVGVIDRALKAVV